MQVSKQIIQCSGCAGKLAVPVAAGGKRFRCPTCRQILVVPGEQPAQQRTAAVANSSMGPTSQTVKSPPHGKKTNKQAAISRQSPPQPKAQGSGQSRELLAGLDQKIPRVRSSLGYQLALMGGAALVGLLPLIYLGLIIAAGMGVA